MPTIAEMRMHAAARGEPHNRKRLEELCRYITRPALPNERAQTNAAGQVVLELKPPGTTARRRF